MPRPTSQAERIEVIDSIQERIARDGLAALTAPELHYYAIWMLESEANNGSFEQFFANTSGALAFDALAGLRAIGAPRMAAHLEQAVALFPAGTLADAQTRTAALVSFTDTQRNAMESLAGMFLDSPDDLATLLKTYVQAQDREFRGPRDTLALWHSRRARGASTTPRTVRDPINFEHEVELDRPYSSRACPECDYPGPDYRTSCKRCGFPHGRAD